MYIATKNNFLSVHNTECPTGYRTRHEDTATKFEQEYVPCVRNEEECVCSAPNCCDSGKIIKEMPGLVASGTHCMINTNFTSWQKPE